MNFTNHEPNSILSFSPTGILRPSKLPIPWSLNWWHASDRVISPAFHTARHRRCLWWSHNPFILLRKSRSLHNSFLLHPRLRTAWLYIIRRKIISYRRLPHNILFSVLLWYLSCPDRVFGN